MNFWLVGLITCVLSYLFVWGILQWTNKHQILAIPNERSSHVVPTPTGGGLAIVILVTIVWAGANFYFGITSWTGWVLPLLGACMIAVVGWLDDLHPLSSKVRFSIQGIAAVLVIFGLRAALLAVDSLWLSRLGYIIVFLWIIGLTNAYNFMDGIDGLAGGQAAVAGFGWMFVGIILNVPEVSFLGLIAATSSLGFLGHNWSPAHIFMGDVGSSFLGFLFAILPLMLIAVEITGAFVIGIFFMWPFLFDTSFTFFKRLRNKENVFQAHRSHLYQRLVILGFSHSQIAKVYILFGCIGVISGLISITSSNWITLVMFILLAILGISLIFFLNYKEQHSQKTETRLR